MLEHLEALQQERPEDTEERERMLMAKAYEKAAQGMPKQGRDQQPPQLATEQMALAHRKRMESPSTRATHRMREYRLPVNRNATFEPAPRPQTDPTKPGTK